MVKPNMIIKNFVGQSLDGNIEPLATFDLKQLYPTFTPKNIFNEFSGCFRGL